MERAYPITPDGSSTYIGPKINGKSAKTLRHYDPSRNIYIFRDEEFSIGPMIADIKSIYEKAASLLDRRDVPAASR